MEEIWRSPVEVDSLSHFSEGFINPRWLGMGFLPSTVSSISFHFHDFQQGFPEKTSIFSLRVRISSPTQNQPGLSFGGRSDPQVMNHEQGDVTDVISTPMKLRPTLLHPIPSMPMRPCSKGSSTPYPNAPGVWNIYFTYILP